MTITIQKLHWPAIVIAALSLSACERNRPDDPAANHATNSAPAQKPDSPSAAPAQPHFKVAVTPFPDEWFYYGQSRSPKLRELEGKPAAELKVKDWIGQPQNLADLKGKVVVIDFWGTWCPPCRAALPHNIEMTEKYKDRGLVIIGVHTARDAEKMPMFAKNSNLNYPLSVDDGDATSRAYHVTFWPTYVVIDVDGTIRGAGLMPDFVDQAIEKVLAEKG